MKTVLFFYLPLVVVSFMLARANSMTNAATESTATASVADQQPLCHLVRGLQQQGIEQTDMTPLTREAIGRLGGHCTALEYAAEAGLHKKSALPALQQHLNAMSRWLTVAELAASTDATDLAQRATHRLDILRPILEAEIHTATEGEASDRLPSATLYNQYQFLKHRTRLLADGKDFATPQAQQQFIFNLADLVAQVQANRQHHTTVQRTV